MNKKGFTLFELIIVVILISIIYYLTLSNFSVKQQKIDNISLGNLKQTLKDMEFDNKISLRCINNKEMDCFFVIDDVVQKNKITEFFKECPEVYEYSKDQIRIEFADDICFEFKLNKSGHSSQMIVDIRDKVFIYDNISSKPKQIKYINDISEFFDEKSREVKDAF